MLSSVAFFQPRTRARANYTNASGDEQTWTPWFACFLAPAVRRAGLRPSLIDARIHPSWRERLDALGPADMLAVSVMSGAAIRDAFEASRRAKAAGAFVVWGGPHVTLFPEQSLAESPADAVVSGFGYAGFEALIDHLVTGSAALPDSVLLESSGRASVGANRAAVVRLRGEVDDAVDTTPDLDLIDDWEPYVNPDIAIADRTVNYVTSEGCLRRCTFCSEPQTSGGSWYVRPVDASVAAIADVVERALATGVKLHDPNFFQNLDRARAFAYAYRTAVGLPWAATIHPADLLNLPEGELERFAAAGLSRVLVGLESPVPKLIRLAAKRFDPSRIPEMAQRLAAARVRGMFTFIVGWPDADDSHYGRTIDAAFGIRAVWAEHQAKIHFLEPWPGTPLYRVLEARGFDHPSTLEAWAEVDYYQAQYTALHNASYADRIRAANIELSPYVEA